MRFPLTKAINPMETARQTCTPDHVLWMIENQTHDTYRTKLAWGDLSTGVSGDDLRTCMERTDDEKVDVAEHKTSDSFILSVTPHS